MSTLTIVEGVTNMLFSSMSTGLSEDGATASKSVFNTPKASGESRSICNMYTNTHKQCHQCIIIGQLDS